MAALDARCPRRPARRAHLAAALVAALGCGGDDAAPSVDAAPVGADAGLDLTTRPSKRSELVGIADPASGALVVFGGDDGPIVNQQPQPAYLDETWLFEPARGWTSVAGAGPSARGRHAVAHDPDGRRMLVFGGRWRAAGTTGNYTIHDDLWAFSVADRAWTRLPAAGGGPAARYYATAAYDPTADTFYVYGGATNANPLQLAIVTDVWAHAGGAWAPIATTGDAPSRRLFMAYTYDAARNALVVFGGQVGDFVSPALNDLYRLELGTGTWSRLHDGNGTAPAGRFSAMMTYDPVEDRYLVMGGHADPGVTNDVWAYDAGAGAWTRLAAGDEFTGGGLGCLGNPAELPATYVDQDLAAPERRSGAVLAVDGDAVWLFGGESDCSDHLDDLWRLDLGTGAWTEVAGARTGESCARRGDDCPCLCL